ncbi:MAG: hypothetical protein AB8F74_16705 [Saprospiraceae bacterium]
MKPLLYIALFLFFCSCNSKFEVALTGNQGTLGLEENEKRKAGSGFKINYGLKKVYRRFGVGFDYEVGRLGYGSDANDEDRPIFQSLLLEGYYALRDRSSDERRVDFGFGVGFGNLPAGNDGGVPKVISLEADIYSIRFPKVYFTSKGRYVGHFDSGPSNLSFELGIGVHFFRR